MKLPLIALVAAGLLVLVAGRSAGVYQDEPQAPAKGTLTLGGNSHKLAHALAYETTRSDRKQTVVILSAKPLSTIKLMQSLKKNGSDEGFFPVGAHVKLSFDERGALAQTVIYADGANILSSGDDNIKAAASIKDGRAKGKAGTEKPGEFFKMSYQFAVTFDVAVIRLAGSTPTPAVDPTTKPKTTQKAKPTPGEPSPAPIADKELRFEGKLADDSPKVKGKPAQIHRVKMSPNTTYVIDLESKDFDTYLRILNSSGKQLASDDDGGEGFNARLRYTPPKEDNYKIVATRFSSGQGNYLLTIRAQSTLAAQNLSVEPGAKPNVPTTSGDPNVPTLVIERELRIEGKLANNSPAVLGKAAQVHRVKMSANKTYVIDLESKEFDPYLRILDSNGKQLANDDDGGEGFNARLRFTPPREGDYQIVATRFGSRAGNYVLKIRVVREGEEKQP